jgi:hypothetical protein
MQPGGQMHRVQHIHCVRVAVGALHQHNHTAKALW